MATAGLTLYGRSDAQYLLKIRIFPFRLTTFHRELLWIFTRKNLGGGNMLQQWLCMHAIKTSEAQQKQKVQRGHCLSQFLQGEVTFLLSH
jgi:hypothetical protein